MISKLIFAGYTGSKNQVRTQKKKIKFDSKSIFFRVCNKLPNWHFKNQAQIDTANVFGHFLEDGTKIKIPSDILGTLSAVGNLETYYNVL